VARALPIHIARSAQNATAIHRKGGDHVEQNQNDVGAGDLCRHGDCGIVDLGEILRVEARAEPEQQHRGDDHVHGGTRERHDKLLGWLLGHLLHAGDAAERPQRHVASVYPIAPCSEHMAKLMQKYAQEDEDDEDRALPGGFGAALPVINCAEPNQKQEKGHVDADRRSADRSERERPTHQWAFFADSLVPTIETLSVATHRSLALGVAFSRRILKVETYLYFRRQGWK
jgi:hypothetical protein